MKWYLNMKIGAKLVLGFLLIALLCAVLGVYSVINLKSLENSDAELYTNMLVPLNDMAKISESLERQRVNIREAIMRDDPSVVEKEIQKIHERRSEIDTLITKFEETILSDKMQTIFDEFVAAKDAFRPLLDQTIALIESGDKEGASALIAEEGAAGIASLAEMEAINKVLEQKVSDGEQKASANTAQADSTILITIILAVITLALSVIIGVIISRIISKPIEETAKCANALAMGQLDTPLEVKSKDEAGQLAATINKEVRDAFKSIEQARAKSEKQSEYQAEQVQKLVVNLERLSQGKLNCDMSVSQADEDTQEIYNLFSNISDSLHDSINTIKGYINEISEILGEMSKGNIDVEIKTDYRGDFSKLKHSINGIANAFNEVLSDINTSAEQVESGTRQVSNGSQEISQGATEQASSIEELTASITQIAEQANQNAENASQANKLSIAASDNAKAGNEQMKQMQLAMVDISESSESISRIIKVIDDIAFQTNILALNAAVEAARAGVHGKGFAVVAEEVRNLAGRSATAAKETTELIEGSINKVEAGTSIGDQTAQALVKIVAGVEEAVGLVGQIATASNEQATAVSQVNRGIGQLSEVVQANSSTSEESAAASEELSSQATLLKNLVGQFTLKSGGVIGNEAPKKSSASDMTKKEKETEIKKDTSLKIVLNDGEFGKY